MRRTILVLAAWASLVPAAHAEWSLGVEPRSGIRALDTRLADYRWDVEPRPFVGVDLVAHRDRWSLAIGVSRSSTEQATGLAGVAAPAVTLLETGATLRAAVLRSGALRVDLGVGAGHLRSTWEPDVLRTDVDGVSIDVRFDPVGTWIRSVDARVGLRLGPALHVGLGAVVRQFDLETAHRSGSAIVESTETFHSVDVALFVRVVGWSAPNPETSS